MGRLRTISESDPPLRVALLASAESFEDFMDGSLGFPFARYLAEYRNDFMWDYAAALGDEGVELLVYWPSRSAGQVARTPDGRTVRLVPVRPWYWAVWARFRVLGRTPVGRWIAEAAHAVAMLRALRGALADDGVDVLYVQEVWTGRFDVLATLLRLPVVGAGHGGQAARQLRLVKPLSFRRAAAMTVQSAAEVAQLARHGVTAELIVNGVDTDRFTPPEAPPAGQRALIVARLDDQQKRVSDAIEAIARTLPEWRLDIVGSGPDEAALRELSQRLGADDRIVFHGFVVDREALLDLYREATVLLMPSVQEASTIAVLEAMSCGVPAVTSSIPAFDAFVVEGETGARFPVGDVPALGAAVERAAAARPTLSPAARQRIVAEYSRRALGRRLASRLRSVRA